jgi:hypothetical protein
MMFLGINEQRIHATARSAIGGEHLAPATVRQAMRHLTYDPWIAGTGRHAVPRVFLSRLPADLTDIQGLAKAQKLFVTMMLPVALRANEIISLQRSMVRTDVDEETMLQAMWQLDAQDAGQLNRRFDITPPSLIIALAAACTDWGRRSTRPGDMFPAALQAPVDLPPSVAKAADGLRRIHHSDLLGPVMDLLHGLNTADGGEALRRERARQRKRRQFDGYRLALLLEPVIALPTQIVKDTLYAIEGGALSRLDSARLEPPGPVFH